MSNKPKRVTAIVVHGVPHPVSWGAPCHPQQQVIQPALSDSIQVRESDNMIMINGVIANIASYRVIVPNLVVGVNFVDGAFEKVVLQKGDKFDLDTAIRICIAKHVGRKYYNLKGIEYLAERLSHLKCIDKMVDKVHKKMAAEKKQQAKEAKARLENIARAERKRLKAEQKRRRRAQDTSGYDDACDSTIHADPSKTDYHTEVRGTQTPPRGSHLNIRTEKHRNRRNGRK